MRPAIALGPLRQRRVVGFPAIRPDEGAGERSVMINAIIVERKTIVFRSRKVSVTTEYPDYDPELCCDGGSYYQPTIKARCRGYILVIADQNCGDFGSDIQIALHRGSLRASPIAEAHYGSLASERYSTFHEGFWAALAAHLGYSHMPRVWDCDC